MKKYIHIILPIIISLIGIVGLIYCILSEKKELPNEVGIKNYREQIKETIKTDEDNTKNTNKKYNKVSGNEININKDIYLDIENSLGWIYVPNTKINYPIMYSGDNEFYLNHDYTGTKNKYGAIFLDGRLSSSLQEDVLLIHGHNSITGYMFSDLKKYRNKSFYKENKQIYLAFGKNKVELKPYNVVATTIVKEDSNIFNLNIDEIKQNIKDCLYVDDSIDISDGQQLILLSTCYGRAGTDKRIVIILKSNELQYKTYEEKQNDEKE